jgi:5-methyltetrahydrofolate--homocysteine methyltransferase
MEELLSRISESIDRGEEEETVKLTQQALDKGLDPISIIQKGLSVGVESAAKKYNEGIYFLPELMLMAESVKVGLATLLPQLEKGSRGKFVGKILIGTVESDVHDLGKNICLSFLVANGFEVVDAGVDISPEAFAHLVRKHHPDIVGIGSYMTTTLPTLKTTIDAIKTADFSGKIIVGGVAVNKAWAAEAGADGYADDAWGCVNLCKNLVGLGKLSTEAGYAAGSEKLKVR